MNDARSKTEDMSYPNLYREKHGRATISDSHAPHSPFPHFSSSKTKRKKELEIRTKNKSSRELLLTYSHLRLR